MNFIIILTDAFIGLAGFINYTKHIYSKQGIFVVFILIEISQNIRHTLKF